MIRAYGLFTHIQANRIRSAVLLAGFVVLLQVLLYAVLLLLYGFTGSGRSFGEIAARAGQTYAATWHMAMMAAAGWVGVAYFINGALINMATGARPVTRGEAPALYNALENLCVSRGIAMPRLQIIDNPALNAFASGLNDRQYAVTVTQGLIDTLSPQEMEAVLAHELTHLRNRDTQLMVVAVVISGVFAFFGDMLIRGWDFPYGFGPRHRRTRDQSRDDRGDSGGGGGSGKGGGGGAIIAIVIAIAVILITYGISTLIRFALSRSREYLADAGAVELTKNPDAMISALRKIERNATMEVPSRMEAFFIENPLKQRLSGFFDTHPSIEERVEALKRFAGGRDDLSDAASTSVARG
jgi:heat shock protein HtpX